MVLFFQQTRAAPSTLRSTQGTRCRRQHGARLLLSSLVLTPTPHHLICCPFANEALSVVLSLLYHGDGKGRSRVNTCLFPKATSKLTPALAAVILVSKTQQNPSSSAMLLSYIFSLCPKSTSSHAALKRYPEKESDVKLPPGQKDIKKDDQERKRIWESWSQHG